jgi:chemotaxis protein CheD
MCHYLLPRRRRPGPPLNGAYAEEALELFMAEVTRRRTVPREYLAGLFGGGHMFALRGLFDVAQMNVEAGRELLRSRGFSLHAEHVGGEGHREVGMELWSGKVSVRQHPLLPLNACAVRR